MRNLVKFVFVFALIVGVIAQPSASFASETEKVNYVSLGDSLAAGQTPDKTLGKGYPDFIAEKFQEAGVLGTYVRDYAVSGYTTQNVLDDITNNVTKGDNPGIQAVLSQATHVTIDVGANDLLKTITIDKTTGAISFDQQEVQKTFAQIQQNLGQIVAGVKTINPNAKIFIMGYYNPFPHLPAESQPILKQSLDTLNTIIEQIAVKSGSVYVPTAEAIAANKNFLPNPQDIHLSEDGYKTVAELFWSVMKPEVKEEPKEEPAPAPEKVTPVVYWDGIILKKGQIGRLTIEKPINLWKRNGSKLEYVRTLHPGETYRVYRLDSKHGGQYAVGAGLYVTIIDGYVKYQTPSKQKLKLVNH